MHAQRSRSRLALSAALIVAAACTSKPTSPAPEPLDLHGRVVSSSGLPVAGVTVSVNGATAQSTGDDGRFDVTGIVPPYDVAVGEAQWSRAVVWTGLRRADPVLTFPWGPVGGRFGSFSGEITGTVSTTFSPDFLVETPVGSTRVTHPVAAGDGPYTSGAGWGGGEPTEVAATVHVLQTTYAISGSDRIATGFPAYGTAGMTLVAGNTVSGVHLALSPVPSTSLVPSATLPAGWTGVLFADAFFGACHGDGYHLGSVFAPPPWPPFAVPSIAGLRTHVWVWGWGPEGGTHVHRMVEAGTSTVDVVVDLPPALLAPAAGTSGVGPGTSFTWTTSPHADLYLLRLFCDDGSSVQVFTEAAASPLPDTTAVGVALGAGEACGWEVVGLGDTAGIDRLAASPADPLTNSPAHDTVQAYSPRRSFTAR